MKNKIISFKETGDSSLEINLSVLAERGGTVKDTAVMDHYGIKVFDWKVEEQIQQYEAKEQIKNLYYKKIVLGRNSSQEDDELETIRNQVFAVSSVPSKTIEDRNNQEDFWENTLLVTILITVMLIVGIIYGRFKKKRREKKLADTNNRYDE